VRPAGVVSRRALARIGRVDLVEVRLSRSLMALSKMLRVHMSFIATSTREKM
jgi:hypothetical protein